jgi:hypothetical protein
MLRNLLSTDMCSACWQEIHFCSKKSISQSVTSDWQSKAEDNVARIRETFSKENVDVVINADETVLLFHQFSQRMITPTGVKHVGSVVQVDNEIFGAMVMIACVYRT